MGSKIPLTVVRGGREETVEATIGEMPQTVATSQSAGKPAAAVPSRVLGMELLPLDRQLRQQLKVPQDVNGVVVGQVESNDPAGELGIQAGDVIVSVAQKPVSTPEEAAAELKQAAAHGNVLLLLNRHGISEFVGLSLENNGTAGSSSR